MKVGILGGTFDPPHLGHLIAAQDAVMVLGLDRVLFIPAGTPPHKRDRSRSPAEVRLAMTRAAVAGDPRFLVDPRETQRAGPSYTVDTLVELRGAMPDARLFLLVGADQYRELETWHRAAEIRSLCQVVVLDREGAASPREPADQRVAVTRIDVSASEVRARVRLGHPIRYLVPPAVEALIEERQLYREVATSPSIGE